MLGLGILGYIIFNWINSDITREVVYPLNVSFEEGDEILFSISDVIADGKLEIVFPNQEEVSSLSDLKSGLYLLNEVTPFIIRSKEPKDVIMVYPYINNMLYSKDESGSILIGEIDQNYTIDRPSELNELDQNMISLLGNLSERVGVIADFDLDEKSYWYDAKLLLIYGKAKFFTQDIIDNLWSYYQKGGVIVFITSDLARYNFNFDRSSAVLSKSNFNGKEWQHADRRFPFTPEDGGVPVSSELKLGNGKKLKVISDIWMGFNNDSNYIFKSMGSIAVQSNGNSNMVEIGSLVNENGSGKLINLGTEAWLYKNNFSVSENRNFLEELILDIIQ